MPLGRGSTRHHGAAPSIQMWLSLKGLGLFGMLQLVLLSLLALQIVLW
jgi:hypothetical protein